MFTQSGQERSFVWGHGVIFLLMLLDFGATFFGNVRQSVCQF